MSSSTRRFVVALAMLLSGVALLWISYAVLGTPPLPMRIVFGVVLGVLIHNVLRNSGKENP